MGTGPIKTHLTYPTYSDLTLTLQKPTKKRIGGMEKP